MSALTHSHTQALNLQTHKKNIPHNDILGKCLLFDRHNKSPKNLDIFFFGKITIARLEI